MPNPAQQHRCSPVAHVPRAGAAQGGRCADSDLAQDIALNLCAHAPSYDETRGTPQAFRCVVARSTITNERRRRHAKCRDVRMEACSLNAPPGSAPDGEDLIHHVDADAHRARLFGDKRPAADAMEMEIDVRRFVERLPESLRELCRLLMRGSVKFFVSGRKGT